MSGKSHMTQGLIALGITAACFVAVMLFFRFLGKPQALGSSAGLNPCAGSPNCVCSTDARPAHHVEPWRSPHDPEQTAARLAVLVRDMPHARVTLHEPAGGYVRAEFRSVVFRFIDDVEFLCQAAGGGKGTVIQVRSASRAGHSDLGVNRRRVRMLREAWEASLGGEKP